MKPQKIHFAAFAILALFCLGAALPDFYAKISNGSATSGRVAKFNSSLHLVDATDVNFNTATVNDLAYNATTWDGSTNTPTRNAIRDQMELKAPLISPSFTTPNIGVGTGTSLALSGALSAMSLDLGGSVHTNGSYTVWGSTADLGWTTTNSANGNYRWSLPSSGLSGAYNFIFNGTNVTLAAASGGGLASTDIDTSAELFGILTDETGSATGTPLAVFNQSPLIVTPTIASFSNANHNHQNSAGGGALDAASITSGVLGVARLPALTATNFHSVANAINVKAPPYNATGDGTTDDSAAIQAAQTAAGANGVVYFPPGTYKHNSVLYPTNGLWFGDGAGRSILLQGVSSVVGGIQTYGNAVPASFRDLEFNGGGTGAYDGGGAGGTIAGLYLDSVGPEGSHNQRVEIINCTFRNYSAEALQLRASHDTLNPRDAFVLVQNCYFTNCWKGIYNREAEYSRIEINIAEECSFGYVGTVPNANIVGNRFTDNDVGIYISGARGHNTITGNAINHCAKPIWLEDVATMINITANNIAGQGIVHFDTSSGFIFSQNACELTEFQFESANGIVKDNVFYHTPATTFSHNYNSTTSRVWVEGNRDELGARVGASPLQTLAAGGIVRVYGPKMKVVGSGGAVTITATPSVDTTAIPDGTEIIIQGTDNTNTITLNDESTTSGSKLELPANRTLGLGDVLKLEWDATAGKWFEVSFTNN